MNREEYLQQFREGQQMIASRYGYNPNNVARIDVYEEVERDGIPVRNIICYDRANDRIVMTEEAMQNDITFQSQHQKPFSGISSLMEINLWVPSDRAPTLVGVEEESHRVFEKSLTRILGPGVTITDQYDGSDTREEHALQEMLLVAEVLNIPLFQRQENEIFTQVSDPWEVYFQAE